MQQLTPHICAALETTTEDMLKRHESVIGNMFPPDASETQMRQMHFKITFLMELHINYALTPDAIYFKSSHDWELRDWYNNCRMRWRQDAVFQAAYFQAWDPITKHPDFQLLIKTGIYGANEWKDSSSEQESPIESPAESPAELFDETVEMGLEQLSLTSNEQLDGQQMNEG